MIMIHVASYHDACSELSSTVVWLYDTCGELS